MNEELAPMSWGEIVERALRFYRQAFLSLYPMYVLPQLVVWALTVAFQRPINEFVAATQDTTNPEAFLAALPSLAVPMVVLLVVGVMVQALQQGAVTLAAASGLLGQPLTVTQAWAGALHRLPSLVLALLVTGLLTLGAMGVGCVFLCAPGLVALVFMLLALQMTVPSIVVDDLGPLQAVGRSWGLMLGGQAGSMHPMLKAFILGVLVFATTMAVTAVGSAPNFAVSMFVGLQSAAAGQPPDPAALSTGWPLVLMSATTLFQTVLASIVPPFAMTVRMLLFYDLKMRREAEEPLGLDAGAAPALS